MRLFIASGFSAPVLERARQIQRAAGPGFGRTVTWVDPEKIHLTYAFLGEVPPGAAQAGIKTAMEAAAGAAGPIAVTMGGLGAFPSFDRPRVLWLGFKEGADALKSLAMELNLALSKKGFIIAGGFSPHITLARVKSQLDGKALAAADDAAGHGVRDSIVSMELLESRLSSAGPDYRVLYTVRLGRC